MNPNVSFFENYRLEGSERNLVEILSGIQKGALSKSTILEIRDHKVNGKDYSELKKNLPGFTPSGTFRDSRRAKNLYKYSQLIVLDIDNIPEKDLPNLKELASIELHTFSAFISPSGNGLKILVLVDSSEDQHKMVFEQVKEHYESKLKVEVDKSGKDVSRLCFVSYDPNLYLNIAAEGFKFSSASGKHFKKAIELTSKQHEFKVGSRNSFVFMFSYNCNRLGIEKEDCLEYVFEHYNYNEDEVKNAVRSAYGYEVDPINVLEKGDDPIERYLNAHYQFRFNRVRGEIESKKKEGRAFQGVDDRYVNSLLRELKGNNIRVTKNRLVELLESDFSPEYHPMREYLFKLPKWDGKKDYLAELARRVETDDDEFFVNAFKKWFVAMVACSIHANIINQTALIFSGGQGIGKSTFIRNLLPKELSGYQYSGMIDPRSKDSLGYLAECFIIDLDELSSLTRKGNNEMKELITKSRVKIRRPYDKFSNDLPRFASFTGSVNDNQFLTDLTGSRRFLCFQVKTIDYKSPIDYHGVYSQALKMYEDGFKFFFDHEDIAKLNERNESFRQKSLVEEILMDYEPTPKGQKADLYLNAGSFLQYLREYHGVKMDETNMILLGKLLSQQGYFKSKKKGNLVYNISRRIKRPLAQKVA